MDAASNCWSTSENWHCAVTALHLSETQKNPCFLLLLFSRILSPHQLLRVHSVGNIFETTLWPKGGLLLLCHYYVPLLSFLIFLCNFTFSAKLCHTDCYYFLFTVKCWLCCVRFCVSGTSCRLGASACARQIREGGKYQRTTGIGRDPEGSPGPTLKWIHTGMEPLTLVLSVAFTHSKSFFNERINFWCRTERLNPKQTFSPISRYVVCYTWRIFFFAFW